MPAPTYTQFIEDYPEFADDDVCPQSSVLNWLEIASLLLTRRWDDTITAQNGSKTMFYVGCGLFAAHHLAIGIRDLMSATRGGAPGIASSTGVGAVSAKAVDEGSVSYDVQATSHPRAGHWNLTTYGTRFWWLANIVGAGPIQVGATMYGFLNPMVPVPMGPAWWGVTVDLGWGPD